MGSRVLVVDDEKLVRWGLRKALEEADLEVDEAGTVEEAREALTRETPDLVLLDLRLPDGSGIDVLREMKKSVPRVPAVVITAHASIDGAVEAMKEGAYDYVSKPFELDELTQTVARALEASRLREEVAHQREEDLKAYLVGGMIAVSPPMLEVARMVRRVARSEGDHDPCCSGRAESARVWWRRPSTRSGATPSGPFMHITCTALPETLLESELFGHEKGAFTDAHLRKRGLFELANGGTVFLDEIGDLPASLQGKLLRFLEDKVFRRVGGSRDIQVTTRIIAATNKDLAKETQEGRFRKDLYYRLRVIPIEIPPLRRRPEDIEPLVEAFVRHFNGEFNKSVRGVEPEALRCMRAYGWPGNVRELRNALERAVLLVDGEYPDPPGPAVGDARPARVLGGLGRARAIRAAAERHELRGARARPRAPGPGAHARQPDARGLPAGDEPRPDPLPHPGSSSWTRSPETTSSAPGKIARPCGLSRTPGGARDPTSGVAHPAPPWPDVCGRSADPSRSEALQDVLVESS